MRKLLVTQKGRELIDKVSNDTTLNNGYPSLELELANFLWNISNMPRRFGKFFGEEKPSTKAAINKLLQDGYVELTEDTSEEVLRKAFPEQETFTSSQLLPPEDLVFTKKARDLMEFVSKIYIVGKAAEDIKLLYEYAQGEDLPPRDIKYLMQKGYLVEGSSEEEYLRLP